MISSKKVLIVDKFQESRKPLVEKLMGDFIIFEAKNDIEASYILNGHAEELCAIIFCVLNPLNDSCYVLHQIGRMNLLNEVPIMVISFTDLPECEAKVIELGAFDYIACPDTSEIARQHFLSMLSRFENMQRSLADKVIESQRETQDMFKTLLELTDTTVITFDAGFSNYVYDHTIKKHLWGDYEGRDFFEVLETDKVASSNQIEEIRAFFMEVEKGKELARPMNVLLKTPKKKANWFKLTLAKSLDDNGEIHQYILTLNNIDKEFTYQRELIYLAKYDKLTGIYNKNTFVKKVVKMLREDSNTTYMMVRFDIDKFKTINDVFGHAEGDRLLRHVACCLSGYASGKGAYCRLNGDMFALCVPHNTENVENLINELSAEIEGYASNYSIWIAFGIYIIEDNNCDVEEALESASFAMEAISGDYVRRYEYYSEAMRDKYLQEKELEKIMYYALEQNWFKVYFQPKVDTTTNKIVGSEALVRWVHPQRGLIPPGCFIDLFERNGFIMKLDPYIWECVCQLLRKWLDMGKNPVPVSVNVSRINLYNPNLCQMLVDLVKKYDLPPHLLEIEITESAYSDNPDALIELVNSLKKNGFKVLMDDFGSGYSSLNVLKDIDVDVLKLDLHFLSGSEHSVKGDAIITSVVSMAKNIGMNVIAEGVEELAQAEFLRDIGCSKVQGYYYYKPMPVDNYEELYEDWEYAI